MSSILQYNPTTNATGYNPMASTKSDNRLVSNPDGTFILNIWKGAAIDVPRTVAVAFTDYGGKALWADSLQDCIFLGTLNDQSTLDLVWDNSKGTLKVGTIFVSVLLDGVSKRFELVILDDPLAPKCNSVYSGVVYLPQADTEPPADTAIRFDQEQELTDTESAQALANMQITFLSNGYLQLVDGNGDTWHTPLYYGTAPV